MAREIVVKKITSGVPIDTSNIGLRDLNDVRDSNVSNDFPYLKFSESAGVFVFTNLSELVIGVSSINGLTGEVILDILDSADVNRLVDLYLQDSTNLSALEDRLDINIDSIDGGSF
mgnify:CR=1 FL=1|tara:strand:+ start:5225 stop:5572 length:348 start_codon:yes stop_codon:yes gene_type:complete